MCIKVVRNVNIETECIRTETNRLITIATTGNYAYLKPFGTCNIFCNEDGKNEDNYGNYERVDEHPITAISVLIKHW